MASWQEEPKTGQTIWIQERGNGIIEHIDYEHGRMVYAFFYENGYARFDYDDLIGNFDESLNQWILPDGITEI